MSIIIDLVIFAIIGFFFYRGYKKGFVFQIFQIVGLFSAFFLTTPIARKLTQITLDNMKQDVQLISLAYSIIVYTIVYFLFHLLGKIFTRKADDSAISLPNKVVGALFSSVKAVFVISLLIVVARLVPSAESFLQKETGIIPQVSEEKLQEAATMESTYIDNGVDSAILPDKPEGFEEEPKRVSQLLYLGYKTSQMMDPFVEDFTQFFYERKAQALKNLEMPDISMPNISFSNDEDSTKTEKKPDEQKQQIDNLLGK